MRTDSRPVLLVLAGSLGLWLICATWVVPGMIESAYRGNSWPFLNRMIAGQATHPVGEYLYEWYRIAATLTIAVLLTGLGLWRVRLVINRPSLVEPVRIIYRGVAILTLNTLLILVAFDLATTGAFKIWSKFSTPTERLVGYGEPRETLSYYTSQDWAAQFWHEFRRADKVRYYPYVGWRRAPFKGNTIEIDQNGIRVTPGADCAANAFRVYAFGASTMWGTGSPNWGTIPAYLQTGLAKRRQGPVCVMNFGETGYVSTQDLLMLLMQLRSGNVPDLALFYSGAGDIYSAYQSGRAGVPENLDELASKFEARKTPPTLGELLTSSSSYSLIEDLAGKLTIANQHEPAARILLTYERMGIDAARLSDSIVRSYFENYNLVDALAQKYGFKYVFFVQPIISQGKKPLTREEQEIKERLQKDEALNKLSTAVYHALNGSVKHRNLYTVFEIFDGYSSLLWIDEFHVTPAGNELIAQKMLQVIQARFGHELDLRPPGT